MCFAVEMTGHNCLSQARASCAILLIVVLYIENTASAFIGSSLQISNWTASALGGHYCTDSFQWTGTGSKLHDCDAAIEQMHEIDLQFYG